MADTLRRNLVRVMSARIVREIKQQASLRINPKNYRHPHPSLNPRNGIQTVELPLEEYEAIAERATLLLKNAGFDIKVEYDASDGNRAFVAQLR